MITLPKVVATQVCYFVTKMLLSVTNTFSGKFSGPKPYYTLPNTPLQAECLEDNIVLPVKVATIQQH